MTTAGEGLCAGAKEFQVEMDVESKKGLATAEFFRIREGENGYVMVGESSRFDAQCSGPDLLPPRVGAAGMTECRLCAAC